MTYGVRRFTPRFRGGRPDCFEVFNKETGDCASPGLFKYRAISLAKAMNLGERRIAHCVEHCGVPEAQVRNILLGLPHPDSDEARAVIMAAKQVG